MSRSSIERRLTEVAARRRGLQEELGVLAEQLAHLDESAQEAQTQALVSGSPLDEQEHRDASRHADAMRRHRDDVLSQVAKLDVQQDELLDQLMAEKAN
jgi:hypothetical protein